MIIFQQSDRILPHGIEMGKQFPGKCLWNEDEHLEENIELRDRENWSMMNLVLRSI